MRLNKGQTQVLLATLNSINNPVFAEDISHLKKVVASAPLAEQEMREAANRDSFE